MPKVSFRSAVAAVDRHGALLVFPVKNKEHIPSLWNVFNPNQRMIWDWSAEGAELIPKIWHLREELSRSGDVVYSKWFQGRATLFSRELFLLMLSPFSRRADPLMGLGEEANAIYQILMEDSPLPTRELKLRVADEGNDLTPGGFDKGIKQLSSRLLVVGYGEVQEGGFPSLAMGATKLLFEELWDESLSVVDPGFTRVADILSADSAFYKHFLRLVAKAPPKNT